MQLWTSNSGTSLGTIDERVTSVVDLPVNSEYTPEIIKISGSLPAGMRLDNYTIKGTPFEVTKSTTSTFVLRASYENTIQDRTFSITIEGVDEPEWITPAGTLAIGNNNAFFILDNIPVNFQLQVIDPDLPAGDNITYTLNPIDGVLPPGIQLTEEGSLVGIIEPLVSYDITTNLNRTYEFSVSASDNESIVTRSFRIYVVDANFLRADNTVMKVANGLYTADNTHIRTPIWVTPSNLGVRRANNYITLFLETIDTNNSTNPTIYTLLPENVDNSNSELPPGLVIDSGTGELAGYVPYQPAITKDYTFSIRAQQFSNETNVAFITGQFYEDTLPGNYSFKIYKLSTDLSDGIDDLRALNNQTININGHAYIVESTIGYNTDYDIINITTPLMPSYNLTVAETALTGDLDFYIDRIPQSVRDQYIQKSLNFSNNKTNIINSIVPYIEWRIVAYDDAELQIDYHFLNQDIPDPSTPLETIIQGIFDVGSFGTTVKVATTTEIRFVAPVTLLTNLNNIRNIIVSTDENAPNYILVNNNKDKVILDVGLQQSLPVNFNIGIAVFKDKSFVKSLTVNADEINSPYADKQFNIKILGEVESVITWNTDRELGTISPNFNSFLSVSATTTVPDSNIIYSLEDGRLPPGLSLAVDGEILGKVNQYADGLGNLGLITFDNSTLTLDGNTTTIDRSYIFNVKAKDRLGFSAETKEFVINVNEPEDKAYSNLSLVPMLTEANRLSYRSFISDATIFNSASIYRPNDTLFGLQKQIKIVAYAGIETKEINEFVAAISLNHKRKKLVVGEVKTAVAKDPSTNNIIYEVVYLDLVDPSNPASGVTASNYTIKTSKRITVDNINYEANDDTSGLLDGNDPFKFRPNGTTFKADNTTLLASAQNNNVRYISNIDNMRDQIKNIGITNSEFLPLWMRTAQQGELQALGFVLAAPICYCKPGTSTRIALNIKNNGFDFSQLNLEVDRYIIDSTVGSSQEQYIVFANYQYNN